jgi:glyoxylase I family protein
MAVPFCRGIHHIAIICGNYARSKRFYTEVLGGQVLRETYRAERQSYKLDLRLPDGVQIELFSFPDPPPRPSRPEAQGLRHLALAVDSLEASIQHLHRHRVVTEDVRQDELTGKRFVFFQDPDQLPIELYRSDDTP